MRLLQGSRFLLNWAAEIYRTGVRFVVAHLLLGQHAQKLMNCVISNCVRNLCIRIPQRGYWTGGDSSRLTANEQTADMIFPSAKRGSLAALVSPMVFSILPKKCVFSHHGALFTWAVDRSDTIIFIYSSYSWWQGKHWPSSRLHTKILNVLHRGFFKRLQKIDGQVMEEWNIFSNFTHLRQLKKKSSSVLRTHQNCTNVKTRLCAHTIIAEFMYWTRSLFPLCAASGVCT